MILALLTSSDAEPILVSIFWLCISLFTGLLIQQAFLINPVTKRLRKLHGERVKLIRDALASESGVEWSVPPIDIKYPFDTWVQLTTDGVIVAGQTFSPETRFTALARDARNIPRAAISGMGNGTVLIQSHGQTYHARFESGEWHIQLINT